MLKRQINGDHGAAHWNRWWCGWMLAAAMSLCGCANYGQNAPIYSRNVALTNENAHLQSMLVHAQAKLAAAEAQLNAKTPRLATLSPQKLGTLFTVSGINISSDTRTCHLKNSPERNGFRVFVKTLMAGSMILPATGNFKIQAFDLADGVKHPLIGRWVFTPMESKKCWYGLFGLDEFGFNCPWKAPPRHAAITFRVSFTDALTGRVFTTQRVITVTIGHRRTKK